jgi:hypothetical protein
VGSTTSGTSRCNVRNITKPHASGVSHLRAARMQMLRCLSNRQRLAPVLRVTFSCPSFAFCSTVFLVGFASITAMDMKRSVLLDITTLKVNRCFGRKIRLRLSSLKSKTNNLEHRDMLSRNVGRILTVYTVLYSIRYNPYIFLTFTTQPVTNVSTRNIKIIIFLGSKVRRMRKTDNLTTICEPIV